MSNWITLTADHLKAAGHGRIIDTARTKAVGGIDPVDEALGDAIARVRRALVPGNTLDADATKVPASLRGVTLRIALFGLMERIAMPLSDDQKDSRRADRDDLKAITENRTRVELPDVPAGTGEMQEVGQSAQAVNVPRRQTGKERTNGL